MRTIPTDQLTDADLDWAAACAMDKDPTMDCGMLDWLQLDPATRRWHHPGGLWSPSTLWEQGGPIIERACIACVPFGYRASSAPRSPGYWRAGSYSPQVEWLSARGATPLVAAMRAYVAFHLGESVQIPEEGAP